MALNTTKIRNVVVAGATVLLLVGIAAGFREENPHRTKLDQRIRDLDSLLVQKRAIARDLERYRAERDRLKTRLDEAKKLLNPPLDAITRQLDDAGVKVTREPEKIAGFYKRFAFVLEGSSREQLRAALKTLEACGCIKTYAHVTVDAAKWRVSLTVFGANLDVYPPEHHAAEDHGVPWYGWINEEQQRRIEEKRRELKKLDEVLGDVNDFSAIKKELEAYLQLIDSASDDPTETLIYALKLNHDGCTGKIEQTIDEIMLELEHCIEASVLEGIAKSLGKVVTKKHSSGGQLRAVLEDDVDATGKE